MPSFTFSMNHDGCVGPDTIQFTNTSTGTVSSNSTYYWFINNTPFDTTIGLTVPDTLVRNNGSYLVSLIVYTPTGCFDTFSQTNLEKPVDTLNPSGGPGSALLFWVDSFDSTPIELTHAETRRAS